MTRHRIARQTLELVIANEADAWPVMAEASAAAGRLAHAIERACELVGDGGHVVRIDRLEIDVGRAPAGRIGDTLAPRVMEALVAALAAPVARREGARPAAAEALELLAIFARDGVLPWWAAGDAGDVVRAAAETPGLDRAALRSLLAEPGVARRLAIQLPPGALATIAARSAGVDVAIARRAGPSAGETRHNAAARGQAVLEVATRWPAHGAEALAADAFVAAVAARMTGGDAPGEVESSPRRPEPSRDAARAGDVGTRSAAPGPAPNSPAPGGSGASDGDADRLARADASPPVTPGDPARGDAAAIDRAALPITGRPDRSLRSAPDPADAGGHAPQPGDDGPPAESAQRRVSHADPLAAGDTPRPHQRGADAAVTSGAADGHDPATRDARAADAGAGSSATPEDAPAGRRPLARPPARSAAPSEPPARRTASAPAEQELGVPVPDAGIVLLWPFMPNLLAAAGLWLRDAFVDQVAHHRAAILIHHVATGARTPHEAALPLAKLIAGLSPDAMMLPLEPIDEREAAEAGRLLDAVVAHSDALGRIDGAALRRAFLEREGMLDARDGHWLLRVERRTHDVLLERLPWTFGWVRLPWMPAPLRVEW